MRPAVTYLRARCLPQRYAALGVLAALSALVARVPMPAVRTDLDAASYPAVLVAAVAPVLVGALATAPAPARLRWLTTAGGRRPRVLRRLELVLVTGAGLVAAAVCGWPADLVGVAVQNAAVTEFAAVLVAPLAGPGVAAAVVGSAAIILLLASPGLPPAPWVLVDVLPDPPDWVAVALLGAASVVVFGLPPRR